MWPLHPSNQDMASSYPGLGSEAGELLCEFRGHVIKGHAPSDSFGSLMLRALQQPRSKKPMSLERPGVGALVDSPLSHPSQKTVMWIKELPGDSSPQPPESPLAKVPNIVQQRQAIPTVPCLNFWPTKSTSIIKWWLFYSTRFRLVYYIAVVTGMALNKS